MPRYTPSYVSALRLHKASGRAVVTLNGRDYPCGKHGTPAAVETYNQMIREWLAAGRVAW